MAITIKNKRQSTLGLSLIFYRNTKGEEENDFNEILRIG